MYRAGAVDVATAAFAGVFDGATGGSPVRDGSRVDEVVPWLGGIPVGTGLLGTTDRNTAQLLQPYVLESVVLGEQARVASTRTLGGDHARTVCCLLTRGENVLGSADPLRTVHELLDGVERR